MAEIYRKVLTNYRFQPDEYPQEKFEVKGRSQRGITLDDVQQVVGALVADLADVEPPLKDFIPEEDVTIDTRRDFGSAQTYVVSATFLRADASTTNAEELGYERAGFQQLTDAVKA